MAIVDDVISRTDELVASRVAWEPIWRDIADYGLPTASRGFMSPPGVSQVWDKLANGPASRDAARKRYDSTFLSAGERLTSGIESLVTPQNEKWHGLAVRDPLAPEASDAETRWFEQVRDYLFGVRYDPRSGFSTANQKAIRSAIYFGTGVGFCEEAFGREGADQRIMPISYQHIPLSQAFIAVDARGVPDTLHRRFSMSARQMVQKFGDKVSTKVKEIADDPKRMDEHCSVIHAVCPREEMGSRTAGVARNAPFASYYVEVDQKHLIGNSGFFEFPYWVYYWLQAEESAYGESPAMLAIDDVRGLNVIRKTGHRAAQQWVDPPIAVSHDGVMNRPNLNPRAVNYGAVDANGRSKIVPIITAQNPSIVQAIVESERNSVREVMYNNLFQILIQNPQMTATEAMLRANEKGELLGPNGAKIQQGLALMVDRELGILGRKGAYEQGATLEPPRSLIGRDVGARFTSPLDRLRRMAEATGIMRTYEAAGAIAAARQDPSVFDALNDDEALKIVAEVHGAPKRIMRTPDEIETSRGQRAQMQQAQSMAAIAEQGGKAANEIIPAIEGADRLAGVGGASEAQQTAA